jgi:hypothetical protein
MARRTPRQTIIARMSLDCAPSASRTPISCTRCDTANDRRPWMPIAANTNATIANADSTRTCTDRDAVSSSTISVSICISVIGTFGSARRMTSRIAPARWAGGTVIRMANAFGRIEGDRAVGHLLRRQVHLWLADAFEPAEQNVARHADDLAVGVGEREMTADGILIRPVALDERLADDRDRLAIAGVTLGDVAPALERNAHRLEVPGVTNRITATLLALRISCPASASP